jgi:hypothetical protein
MITINNYFHKITDIDFSILPEALRKGHEFILKGSKNGESWTFYSSSPTIKNMVDIYLSKLNEYIGKGGNRGDKASGTSQKQQPQTKSHKVSKPRRLKPSKEVIQPIMVERVPEELRFIKRYINLNGKIKTKEEILRFINTLQKAIVEKRIRKTSPYADQVKYIQEKLIDVHNNMKAKVKLELQPQTLESLAKLTSGEKVLVSVGFIKRYISMNGKPGMKEKAKKLLTQINRAIDKGRLTETDPYMPEIYELKKNLKAFSINKAIKVLEIEQAALNGLEGILGCACQNLNGIDSKPAIMNSMDFANLEFNTLGFTGKWLELIGDPSSNFTAMIFGRPKMGKSYLCVDFAGYLARNHGKVLYVAKEEGLDYTLQQKLNDKNVKHPNLYVASILPTDLSPYDFIFLDSVSKLGLAPEDLNKLKVQYPSKSFIFIFQSTKDGKFRGANTFQHDVDIVIEVPERGKAIQMGRFNQGGELEIFDNTMAP